ncbi:unnamed protein product [Bemisia tabaci]|uniref:Uncharacterized protein n=1 Tax=Bemisia tabaci TaxID=7038 RepID=A0A9P0F192_BEMTA|nr:unnamed protein product [Bemisia tabaci]
MPGTAPPPRPASKAPDRQVPTSGILDIMATQFTEPRVKIPSRIITVDTALMTDYFGSLYDALVDVLYPSSLHFCAKDQINTINNIERPYLSSSFQLDRLMSLQALMLREVLLSCWTTLEARREDPGGLSIPGEKLTRTMGGVRYGSSWSRNSLEGISLPPLKMSYRDQRLRGPPLSDILSSNHAKCPPHSPRTHSCSTHIRRPIQWLSSHPEYREAHRHFKRCCSIQQDFEDDVPLILISSLIGVSDADIRKFLTEKKRDKKDRRRSHEEEEGSSGREDGSSVAPQLVLPAMDYDDGIFDKVLKVIPPMSILLH